MVDHVVDASTPDLVGAAVEFARRRFPEVAGGLGALRSGGRLLKVWSYMHVCGTSRTRFQLWQQRSRDYQLFVAQPHPSIDAKWE